MSIQPPVAGRLNIFERKNGDGRTFNLVLFRSAENLLYKIIQFVTLNAIKKEK